MRTTTLPLQPFVAAGPFAHDIFSARKPKRPPLVELTNRPSPPRSPQIIKPPPRAIFTPSAKQTTAAPRRGILPCCAVLFAHGCLLLLLLVIVGVTAYDGWPANESDYWVRLPLCGGPSRCVATTASGERALCAFPFLHDGAPSFSCVPVAPNASDKFCAIDVDPSGEPRAVGVCSAACDRAEYTLPPPSATTGCGGECVAGGGATSAPLVLPVHSSGWAGDASFEDGAEYTLVLFAAADEAEVDVQLHAAGGDFLLAAPIHRRLRRGDATASPAAPAAANSGAEPRVRSGGRRRGCRACSATAAATTTARRGDSGGRSGAVGRRDTAAAVGGRRVRRRRRRRRRPRRRAVECAGDAPTGRRRRRRSVPSSACRLCCRWSTSRSSCT